MVYKLDSIGEYVTPVTPGFLADDTTTEANIEGSHWKNLIMKMDSDKPTTEQKIFLVAGVALATVCSCTNFVQTWIFARPSSMRSVKNMIFFSQAISGILAAFIPMFPISVISDKGGSLVGEAGYDACYLGHSAIILITLLTSVCSATLLVIHHYLMSNQACKYSVAGNSLAAWGLGILFMWFISITIALLPWGGWNSWKMHDARCHLSTIWPLSFSVFLVFVVAVHMAITLFMWAASRNSHLKATSGRLSVNVTNDMPDRNDPETVPIAPEIRPFNHDGRISVGAWAVTIGCSVPLVGHVLLASSCAASSVCISSPHHYHEDTAALPWASLFLTAAAIVNPLLYVFSDDQVSTMTVFFLSKIFCCWRKRRQDVIPTTTNDKLNSDENAYVTNDTAHLVADNT